jgi:hypothetical protein
LEHQRAAAARPKRSKVFTQKQRIKNGERRELLDDASRKETAPSGVVVVSTGELSKDFARAHHLSHLTPSLE